MRKVNKLKVFTLWMALFGFLLVAPLSSCGNKKESSDTESQEHPSDEHPGDNDEHPSDSEEHPN
ncbi:hypothetical protein [Pleomorphovibrio marinus]|uniref:hypothetical protein n=1 Tax=Pleomorphovibrio marinus TaxID=2164132 RepID=UPI000E0C77BD|nr:hypothetical protein [Pleomorphovibrio marinus]